MAVGAVANATEKNFEKYMPHFRPFLSLGLSNNEEHQVCQVAVGVVGDICRALEVKVLPYCDEIVALLLRSLQNSSLNRNVKPPILSCFGDIALAIGGHFEKYMQVTMNMLQQASMTEVDTADPDLLDYLHALREGILEAYTGVLQACAQLLLLRFRDERTASGSGMPVVTEKRTSRDFARRIKRTSLCLMCKAPWC